jgi:uncharacterized protein Yka (UPF0111/DUF47 family)
MTEKNRIIDALGERKLLLPVLVNAALAANDQTKYLFTLLQMAKSHADHPHAPFSDLRQERLMNALDDEDLDHVVEVSAKGDAGTYRMPGAERIVSRVMSNLRTMLDPLEAAAGDGRDDDARELAQRYGKFAQNGATAHGDIISAAAISQLTSGDREHGDSPHLLVMDMHKALNRLQAAIAAESIDGARVYEIKTAERPLVKAFMRGVNQTAPLKFEHPGLGTTATHAADKLVIQNDIGTTDAHVLVVHVSGQTVALTYTDIHLQRLLFFESLFERHQVQWDDTLSRKDKTMESGVYHLSIGRYAAGNKAELEDYLTFLGSRLVFLIDWNRARKRLRNFLAKDDTLQLLKWAADQNLGHRAFLKLGGEQLIYDALEFVVKGPHHFGERLTDMLGRREAAQYLRFVLKACSEGLREGRAEPLIRDEVKVELLNYFRSAQQSLIDIAADHAALIVELASGIHDALLKARLPDAQRYYERNARRAKDWERQADDCVNRARTAVKLSDAGAFFRSLVEAADDVADDLEDAAFQLTLLPKDAWRGEICQPVQSLSDLLVQGAQEFVKALETTRYLHRGGAREDVQDFLEAVHRIIGVEQQTDEAQRNAKRALVQGDFSEKELYVYTGSVKSLEESADALMHAALMLRDYVLGEVMLK